MAALIALSAPAPAQVSESQFAQARAVAESIVERQQLAGLQLSIGRVGEAEVLGHCIGLANVELDVPMRRSTLVPIASVMKALTGVLFLKLEQEGDLDRKVDVRELVPEFPEQDAPITLGMLVGQTHGIRHYRDEVYPQFFVQHFERFEDALPIFAKDELVAAPGARFTYSSYAYTLLGLALERATEQRFEDLLRTHVLKPAGVERVCANDVRVPIQERATCYSHYEPTWPFDALPAMRCVPPLDMSYNSAGGNRLASADDLVRFGTALLQGQLLGEAAMARLQQSQTTAVGEATGWSHGWFVINAPEGREIRINGSNPGSWASLRLYPKTGHVIAMTTNTWGRGSRRRPKGLIGAMDELRAIALR